MTNYLLEGQVGGLVSNQWLAELKASTPKVIIPRSHPWDRQRVLKKDWGSIVPCSNVVRTTDTKHDISDQVIYRFNGTRSIMGVTKTKFFCNNIKNLLAIQS